MFAELCILDFLENDWGAKVIVLVPTLTLLDQWYVSIREEMCAPEQEIATYSGEGRPSAPRRINIMVLNTARTTASQVASDGRTFLIVDECHRAASPKNAQALVGRHAATLGMSATPFREYDDGFDEVLEPALGSVVYNYDYNDALRDGIIAPFDLANIGIDLLPSEHAEYSALSRRIGICVNSAEGRPDDDALVKLLCIRRARVAARAALRVPAAVRVASQHAHDKVIVFHEAIESAEAIQALLTARGVSSTVYHSRLGPATRRDNLRLFRRGVFDVLVSCRALDEGTNVPEASVAVIASATASSRQRIQRMGRVLRPAAGKERALIYTIYATSDEEQRLARESRSLVGADSITWQKVEVDV